MKTTGTTEASRSCSRTSPRKRRDNEQANAYICPAFFWLCLACLLVGGMIYFTRRYETIHSERIAGPWLPADVSVTVRQVKDTRWQHIVLCMPSKDSMPEALFPLYIKQGTVSRMYKDPEDFQPWGATTNRSGDSYTLYSLTSKNPDDFWVDLNTSREYDLSIHFAQELDDVSGWIYLCWPQGRGVSRLQVRHLNGVSLPFSK